MRLCVGILVRKLDLINIFACCLCLHALPKSSSSLSKSSTGERETLAFFFRICLDEHAKSLPSPPPPDTELLPRKKPRQMDRLRRTLSFRSRKKGNTSNNNNNNNTNHSSTPAATSAVKNGSSTTTTTTTAPTTADSKPSQWQDDEKSVRVGACSFTVKVSNDKCNEQ